MYCNYEIGDAFDVEFSDVMINVWIVNVMTKLLLGTQEGISQR